MYDEYVTYLYMYIYRYIGYISYIYIYITYTYKDRKIYIMYDILYFI